MGYQMCPTCQGQRFIEASISSFRFLLGLEQPSPSNRRACHQCQGQGRKPMTEDVATIDIDLDQPDGFQGTATFAYFNPEPQSPALRGPKPSRETVPS